MTKDLDDLLVSKYPKIFAQRYKSMEETAMCWGFECGDGWFWLIDKLCESIQNYIDSNHKQQLEATQVKEKYGSLRFYYTGGDKLIEGMIWLAEFLSNSICENCGEHGENKTINNWLYTLCEECNKKQHEGI